MKKEITANCKFKKDRKYYKNDKILKSNIFLLTICLTHLYNTFPPYFWLHVLWLSLHMITILWYHLYR